MTVHGLTEAEGLRTLPQRAPAGSRGSCSRNCSSTFTSFFRDPEAFDTMKKEVLLGRVAAQPEGQVIRVWVSRVCHRGRGLLDRDAPAARSWMNPAGSTCVQIYGTDLDEDAVADRACRRLPSGTSLRTSRRNGCGRFFVKEEVRLPSEEGDPEHGRLRSTERDQRPAVHQAGSGSVAGTC